ncbi:hypothetical protein NEAUS06_0035 [Nematocida ausubeli]|nr:hypothetical protein NEAUS06_0035 [Nematocida ausubeli]
MQTKEVPHLQISTEHSYIHIISAIINVKIDILNDDTILTEEGKKIKGPARCISHLLRNTDVDEQTLTSISNVISLRPQQMLAYVAAGPAERIDNLLAVAKIRKWLFEGQITNKVSDHLINKLIEIHDRYQDIYVKYTNELYIHKDLVRPIAEFYKIVILSGRIDSIMDHPEADTLFIENVDFKNEKRTVVSGLKGKFEKSKLLGACCLFAVNLKSVSFKGTKSFGMILFGKGEGSGSVIFTGSNGSRLGLLKYPLCKLVPFDISVGDASKRSLEVFFQGLNIRGRQLLYNGLETEIDGETVTVQDVENGIVS